MSPRTLRLAVASLLRQLARGQSLTGEDRLALVVGLLALLSSKKGPR